MTIAIALIFTAMVLIVPTILFHMMTDNLLHLIDRMDLTEKQKRLRGIGYVIAGLGLIVGTIVWIIAIWQQVRG